jgi:hypothetical protein
MVFKADGDHAGATAARTVTHPSGKAVTTSRVSPRPELFAVRHRILSKFHDVGRSKRNAGPITDEAGYHDDRGRD